MSLRAKQIIDTMKVQPKASVVLTSIDMGQVVYRFISFMLFAISCDYDYHFIHIENIACDVLMI